MAKWGASLPTVHVPPGGYSIGAGSLRITCDKPDTTGRAVMAAYKKALQSAFRFHRWKYLPFHFSKAAFLRYPQEYANSGARSNPLNQGGVKQSVFNPGSLSPKRLAMYNSPEARQARGDLIAESRKSSKGQAYLTSRDRRNEIPLYDTGRTKSMVLQGAYSFAGNPDNYKMSIPVPPYISWRSYRTDGKMWDKKAAAEAVRKDEIEIFVQNVSESMDKYFARNNDTATATAS